MKKILTAPGMNRCIGCYSCMLACARTVYDSFSPRQSAIQIKTAGGLQSKMIANICRGCVEAPCAQACGVGALEEREGGGVRFRKEKCIGCQDCVEACVLKVINFDSKKDKPIICIQCGTCSRFCPHECLAMEVVHHV